MVSDRETVIELVSNLPEDTSLEEIVRRIEFLSGVKAARAEARAGKGIPAEDARKLVDAWASR